MVQKKRLFWLMIVCLIGSRATAFFEDSPLFTGTYSENYIIRWEFQKLCKHTFDPRTDKYLWPTSREGADFNPKKVKKGDLIFVRNLDTFFARRYKQIKQPFIMVTAGEFRDKVEKRHLAYLDDTKIIAWFSIHPSSSTHPKFYTIPIGVYQDKEFYSNKESLAQRFAFLRTVPKKNKLYMNFGDLVGGKPERARAEEMLKGAPFCYSVQKRLPFLLYIEEMATFKFTLSPPGYGPDCYRTWEALLVGSIPILKTSHMDSMFKDLPVLIVNDWDEITEELLERTYEHFSGKRYSIAPLFIEYWAEKIKQVRDSFFERI